MEEAGLYFASNTTRIAYCTRRSESFGLCADNGTEWWWLRSPGKKQDYAALVDNTGKIVEIYGDYVNDDDIAIRPAMWIDIG